jgi:hypothetical protein
MLGSNLDELAQSPFLARFHLVEEQRALEGAREVVVFQPEGYRMRPFVTLLATAQGGRVVSLELLLARLLVDHPAQGVFARDIAAALLSEALPQADHPAVHTLLAGLEGGEDSPSPGCQVYLARAARHEQSLGSARIKLENLDAGVLSVQVAASAPAPPPPQVQARPCPGCQRPNVPQARFCKFCGTPMEAQAAAAPAPPAPRCSRCGRPYQAGLHLFCTGCGTRLA